MKMSAYKNYDDLPLFLNASMVSLCCASAAAWWCRRKNLSGGQRSSPEVPNEETALGQA